MIRNTRERFGLWLFEDDVEDKKLSLCGKSKHEKSSRSGEVANEAKDVNCQRIISGGSSEWKAPGIAIRS
jgi:hypothetical protein